MCQGGNCFDPIDFSKDSPEIIIKKLIKNVAYYVKLRNEAIANNTNTNIYAHYFAVNTLSEADLTGWGQIHEHFQYEGANIEILVNFTEGETASGIANETYEKRYSGGKLYYDYKIEIITKGRSKIANDEGRTHNNPYMFKIYISDKDLYDRIILEINKKINE